MAAITSFQTEECCRLVSTHTASDWCLCTSIRQFLIYSTSVLVHDTSVLSHFYTGFVQVLESTGSFSLKFPGLVKDLSSGKELKSPGIKTYESWSVIIPS